jgi:hypothetical protein
MPNFLPEKNLGSPYNIFEKKIDLCEKGDEITPFDGIPCIMLSRIVLPSW